MNSEAKPQPRRRRRRVLRVLLVLALLATAGLAAAWVWIESAPGQESIRRWIEVRGTELLGRNLRVAAVEVDLVPFDALLTGIEVDGAAGSDQLLLRADSVRLRVEPWALLSRELRLRSVDIDRPVVHWDIGGESNLVLEAGGDNLVAVTVESLSIESGLLEINHRRWNLDTSLTAVSLRLQPGEGGFAVTRQRSGTLRIGGGGLRVEANLVEGQTPGPGTIEFVGAELPFTLDGHLLRLEDAHMRLGASELTASGELREWSRGEFAIGGRLDVRDLVRLSGIELSDTDAGIVTLDASLTFGPDPLRFAGTLSSPTITLAGIEATGFAADVDASAADVVVDNARASLFEGDVTARVDVNLASEPRAWRLEYEVSGVNLAALTRSPALPGFRFAGTGSGSGSLSWRAPLADTISGSGSFDLALPAGTLDRLSLPAGTLDRLGAGLDEPPGPDGPAPSDGSAAAEPAAATNRAAQDDLLPATQAPETSFLQRVAPSLLLPVAAHAEYQLTNGSLEVRNTTVSLPSTVAGIEATVARDGSISGRVTLESGDLRMLDRFFNQIRRFRGEQPVPRPLGIAGSGLASGTIGGSVDAPTFDGVLEARSLSVAGNPVGDVDGTLRLAGAALEIIDLELRRNGGTANGEGRFRIGQRVSSGPDYSIVLRLDGFPMEVNLPRLGVPLSVAGETTGELTLAGEYGASPSGEVTLKGAAVRLNGVENLTADVHIRLTPEEWIVERFELGGDRGQIAASGAWRRNDDTVQARVDGFDIDASIAGDLIGVELPVSGTLQLVAQISGPFSAPDAAATLRWTDAGAYGATLGSVAWSAELRGGSLAVSAIGRSGATAPAVPPPTPTAAGGDVAIALPEIPAAGWAATLSADLQAPRRATLRAAGDSELVLALLAAQGYDTGSDLDLRGTLTVAGSGEMGDWTGWSGTAVLADFALSRPGLALAIPEPLRLELDAEILRIELPQLVSDAGNLEASAAINVAQGRWVEATASGRVSLNVLEVFVDDLEAGGALQVALRASGEVLAGEVAGSFELYDVSLGRPMWPWAAEGINGTVLLAGNSLDLVDVRGIIAGQPFTAEGEFPLASLAGDDSAELVRLDVSVDALPLRPLWEKTGRLHQLITGGEASVTLSVQGSGTNWREYQGRLDLRALRIDIADLQLRMPQPTSLRVTGSRLETIDAIVLQGPGTDLRVSGAFLLGPFRLDARLQGSANLDPLNAVTGSWGVAGRAEMDIGVAGDPPELSYDGSLTVSSGLLNAPVLQPIENISALITLQNQLVRIEHFEGSLGDAIARASPNVSGSGEIQLRNSVPQRFVLNLAVAEALLRIQQGIRVTASADLVHEGTFDRSILSGTMTLTKGEYTRRWEGEEGLMSLSNSRVAGIDHPLAGTVSLDLEVSAPGELRIVNNVADVELNADLQIRGTLANPVLLGSATVLDGSVLFRDQRYRFLRGSIEFQNPLRTEPSFDIAIETSIRQYLVTVNVSGSPARGDVNATFISSPPLSDLQLIQLLTVGDASEENLRSDDDTLGVVGAQATSFLTRQYLSQVERGAQRVFGIDRFRVEPSVVTGTGDPTARVTIGKQVTPDLWVSWTTVLGTTEEQLVTLEYQLTRGIRLTATREEDGSLGVDIRFDHRFR